MNTENNQGAPAISARDVKKHFGKIKAVDGVSFDVKEGLSFGFLGPNGAGKTTLMRMIYCQSHPTGGSLRVLGLDPVTQPKIVKKDIGVVPQESSLDDDLTIVQNLLLFSRYHAIPKEEAKRRTEELLEFANLADRRDSRVPELSGGMQRRLLIARALINNPKILVLDEPTTGLDPQVRHIIWQRMRALKRKGITLLVTTHYMEEAENLCDEIVVMDSGKIIEQGAPRELITNHIGNFVLEAEAAGGGVEAKVRKIFEGAPAVIERFGDRVYVYAKTSDVLTQKINDLSDNDPILRPATLEDVFLKLTGRDLKLGA